MRSLAPIAMSAFSAMALAAVSTLAMSILVSSARRPGMTRAPYSAEFGRPAASATVRLAWIWMGDWFMLQTVTKI
jgi:hypothetical protein